MKTLLLWPLLAFTWTGVPAQSFDFGGIGDILSGGSQVTQIGVVAQLTAELQTKIQIYLAQANGVFFKKAECLQLLNELKRVVASINSLEMLNSQRSVVIDLYARIKAIDGSQGVILQVADQMMVQVYGELEFALKINPGTVPTASLRLFASFCQQRIDEINAMEDNTPPDNDGGNTDPPTTEDPVGNTDPPATEGPAGNTDPPATDGPGGGEDPGPIGEGGMMPKIDLIEFIKQKVGLVKALIIAANPDDWTTYERIHKVLGKIFAEIQAAERRLGPDQFEYACAQSGWDLKKALELKDLIKAKAAKIKMAILCQIRLGENPYDIDIGDVVQDLASCLFKGERKTAGSPWNFGTNQWDCIQVERFGKLISVAKKIACYWLQYDKVILPGGSYKYRNFLSECRMTRGKPRLYRRRGGKFRSTEVMPANSGHKKCCQDMCMIPKFKDRVMCKASGDPHTKTFDGAKQDYQGTCRQILVEKCSDDSSLPDFKVIMKNEHRDGKNRVSKQGEARVSFVKYVELEINGVTIRLGKSGKLKVNGSKATAPYFYPPMPENACDMDYVSCQINVIRKGRRGLVLNTDFGLSLEFDGKGAMKVFLPKTMKGHACGTCGFYDGAKNNDLMLPNGEVTTNHRIFGDAWRLRDTADPKCVLEQYEGPKCNKAQVKQAKEMCGAFLDAEGPFAACLADPDLKEQAEDAFDDCVYDVCAMNATEESRCGALETFASACTEQLNTGIMWRGPAQCPMECPANMEFKACGPMVVGTCDWNEPVQPDDAVCVEDCFCQNGMVFEDGKCINYTDCGCTDDNGAYRWIGDSWNNEFCTETCTCAAGGTVTCLVVEPCAHPLECATDDDGNHGCDCAQGYEMVNGTCENVDECAQQYTCSNGQACNICGANAVCTDSIGSFECSCAAPYESVGGICLQPPAQCQAKIDIAYVIDASGSVGEPSFQLMKDSAKNMVDKFEVGPTKAQFGTVVFSGSRFIPNPVRVVHDLNDVYVPAEIKNEIQGMEYINRLTATGDALMMTKEKVLSAAGGMRSDATQMILLMVDGIKNIGYDPQMAADAMRAAGYKVQVVGLLARETSAEYIAELEGIGAPLPVIWSQTFESLNTALSETAERLCFEASPCPDPNMEKLECISCPVTCQDANPVCTIPSPCPYGCMCKAGYVMDSLLGQCVQPSQCGCTDEFDIYRSINQQWTNENCNKQCTCLGQGNIECVDMDLCSGKNEGCNVEDGIHQCVCEEGYEHDNTSQCVDINECNGSPCGDNEDCTNTEGSFECNCSPGYEMADEENGACENVDECSLPTFAPICGDNEVCVDNPGSYSCECDDGYESNEDGDCVDINECLTVNGTDSGICTGENERCVNNEGSFECVCQMGFQPNQNGTCENVNECAVGKLICGQNGECTDTEGSYTCACQEGYTKNRRGVCSKDDDDEEENVTPPSKEELKDLLKIILREIIEIIRGCSEGDNFEDQIKDLLEKIRGLIKGPGGRPNPFEYKCNAFITMLRGAFRIKIAKRIELIKKKIMMLCAIEGGLTIDFGTGSNEDKEVCRHRGKLRRAGTEWTYGKFIFDCVKVSGSGKWKPKKTGCVCKDKKRLRKGEKHWMGAREYSCETNNRGWLKLFFKLGKKLFTEVFKPATTGHKKCCEDRCLLPKYEDRDMCTAKGDPHTYTFDGTKQDYQGTCRQVLVEKCHNDTSLPDFRVIMKNEHRDGKNRVSKNGGARVSFVKYVELEINGMTFRLGKGGKLKVNGAKVTAPFFHPPMPEDACDLDEVTCQLSILRKGRQGLVLNTDFGLTLEFDGKGVMKVFIPKTLRGLACGTCGFYDGAKDNDLMLPNGDLTQDHQIFGDAWRLKDPKDPKCVLQTDGPKCKKALRMKAREMCQDFLNLDGPFAQCLANEDLKAQAEEAYEDCVYDVCANNATDESRCGALETFASACAEQLNEGILWRGPTECPMECPANMEFKACGPTVVGTCDWNEPVQPDDATCVEDCFCKNGLVLENGKCINYTDCGCSYEETYRSVNESWSNQFCNETCTCMLGGDVICAQEDLCPFPFVCAPGDDGNHGCGCAQGYEMDATGNCVNANECAEQYTCSNGQPCNICGANAVCTDTEGSFKCSCAAPYESVGGICIQPPGKCQAKIDIVYIIDASGSVGADSFQLMKDSAKNMIDKFDVGPTKAQFGSIVFSGSNFIADPVRVIHDLNDVYVPAEIKSKIQGMEYINRLTATGDALMMAKEKILVPAGGMRGDATQVVILMVDGIKNIGQDPQAAANALRTAGYKVQVVGLLAREDSAEYKAQLEGIGAPLPVIWAETFESLNIALGQTADRICYEATPCPDPNMEKTECISCPITCQNDAPMCTIPSPCPYGCMCKAGYVMDNLLGKCVQPSACGCTDEFNIYRSVNQQWTDSNCNEDCTCQGQNNIVCSPAAYCDGSNEACNVDDGLHQCVCEEGYQYSNVSECVDIDECVPNPLDPNGPCGENEDCSNTMGSYKCSCSSGYEPDDNGVCVNINECEQSDSLCGRNEVCVDNPGSYDCVCNEGFERNDADKCVDINECKAENGTDSDACGENEKCKNTIGSFTCLCEDGYERQMDNGTCENINECLRQTWRPICGMNGICIDTDGSYECNCTEGYVVNDGGQCGEAGGSSDEICCIDEGTDECEAKIDLVFLFDGSGSVTTPNFEMMKQAASDVLQKFTIGETNTRVATVRFSSPVTYPPHFDEFIKTIHHLDDLFVLEDIEGAINDMEYLEGWTATGDALRHVQENILQEDSGMRPDAKQVIIAMIDGERNTGEDEAAVADELREMGVEIFVIGITQYFNHQDYINQLQAIAGPNPKNLLITETFEGVAASLDLAAIMVCDAAEICEGEACCPADDDDEGQQVTIEMNCDGGNFAPSQNLSDVCDSITITNNGEDIAPGDSGIPWHAAIYVIPRKEDSDPEPEDWDEEQCIMAKCKPPTAKSCLLEGGLIPLENGLPSGSMNIDLSEIILKCEDGEVVLEDQVTIVVNLDPLNVNLETCVVASLDIDLEDEDDDDDSSEQCVVLPDFRTNGLSAFIANGGNKALYHYNPMNRGEGTFFPVHKYAESVGSAKMKLLKSIFKKLRQLKGNAVCKDNDDMDITADDPNTPDDEPMPQPEPEPLPGEKSQSMKFQEFIGLAKQCKKNNRIYSTIRKMSCSYKKHLRKVFSSINEGANRYGSLKSKSKRRAKRDVGMDMMSSVDDNTDEIMILSDEDLCVEKLLRKATGKAIELLSSLGPKKLKNKIKAKKDKKKKSKKGQKWTPVVRRSKRDVGAAQGLSMPNFPDMDIPTDKRGRSPGGQGGWGFNHCDDDMMDSLDHLVGADDSSTSQMCNVDLPHFFWKIKNGVIYQGYKCSCSGKWRWRSRALCQCEDAVSCKGGNGRGKGRDPKGKGGRKSEGSAGKGKGSGGRGNKYGSRGEGYSYGGGQRGGNRGNSGNGWSYGNGNRGNDWNNRKSGRQNQNYGMGGRGGSYGNRIDPEVVRKLMEKIKGGIMEKIWKIISGGLDASNAKNVMEKFKNHFENAENTYSSHYDGNGAEKGSIDHDQVMDDMMKSLIMDMAGKTEKSKVYDIAGKVKEVISSIGDNMKNMKAGKDGNGQDAQDPDMMVPGLNLNDFSMPNLGISPYTSQSDESSESEESSEESGKPGPKKPSEESNQEPSNPMINLWESFGAPGDWVNNLNLDQLISDPKPEMMKPKTSDDATGKGSSTSAGRSSTGRQGSENMSAGKQSGKKSGGSNSGTNGNGRGGSSSRSSQSGGNGKSRASSGRSSSPGSSSPGNKGNRW